MSSWKVMTIGPSGLTGLHSIEIGVCLLILNTATQLCYLLKIPYFWGHPIKRKENMYEIKMPYCCIVVPLLFLWTCLVVVGYFTRFVHWHEKRESRTTSRKWLTGSLQFWCQHQKQPLPYLFLGSPYFLHTPLNLEILKFWIKVWKIRKQFEVLRSLPSPSKNWWVNKYGSILEYKDKPVYSTYRLFPLRAKSSALLKCLKNISCQQAFSIGS